MTRNDFRTTDPLHGTDQLPSDFGPRTISRDEMIAMRLAWEAVDETDLADLAKIATRHQDTWGVSAASVVLARNYMAHVLRARMTGRDPLTYPVYVG